MKKILLLSMAMLCLTFVSKAQDNKYSIGLGFGGASASAKDEAGDKESGFGFNFYLNGMYNVNANISAGLEYNGNLVVIGSTDITGVSLNVTKINGILAKGRYLFGEGNTRFFGGLMLGIYIIEPGGVTIDLGQSSPTLDLVFEKATVFGFAPEIGVQMGSFQLATSYHLPGKYKSDLLGSPVELNYTVWQFNIGWNIGFGG